MDIKSRVLLLGLYKNSDISNLETILMLVNSGVFSLKEGKQYFKTLKKEGFISNGKLTPIGINLAKEIELEFKL